MKQAKTSFSTEIFAGAISRVAQYEVLLRCLISHTHPSVCVCPGYCPQAHVFLRRYVLGENSYIQIWLFLSGAKSLGCATQYPSGAKY
jgi:hypothetical protein